MGALVFHALPDGFPDKMRRMVDDLRTFRHRDPREVADRADRIADDLARMARFPRP